MKLLEGFALFVIWTLLCAIILLLLLSPLMGDCFERCRSAEYRLSYLRLVTGSTLVVWLFGNWAFFRSRNRK